MGERPMRVAVLTHGYVPRMGGIERQRAQVTPRLRERGLDPFVITRHVPGTRFREVREGVEVFRTPTWGAGRSGGVRGRIGRAIDALSFEAIGAAILLVRRPDVIHTHEFLSTARLGLLIGRLLRVPVIATAHLSGPTGDVGRSRNSRSRRRLLRRIQRKGALTIAVSSDIDRELADAGFPPERRMLIANGVDTDRFRPAHSRERDALRDSLTVGGDPLVVFTGRLESQKRVDVLLDAWSEVSAATSTATLLVLGSGSQSTALQEAADGSVWFGGAVDEVAPFLRASDVFVLPSDAEGMSNALLEAQASGLPAVATDVGGARDVVVAGVTGLLVPPGDAVALGDALARLAHDPAMRSRMGRAARERTVAEFSLDRTVDGFIRAYERTTGRSTCLQD